MEKYRPMLLKDFFSRFPDEDSCVVDSSETARRRNSICLTTLLEYQLNTHQI
jgi:predicted PolB exonuclease-like 3'-5' exonuclease